LKGLRFDLAPYGLDNNVSSKSPVAGMRDSSPSSVEDPFLGLRRNVELTLIPNSSAIHTINFTLDSATYDPCGKINKRQIYQLVSTQEAERTKKTQVDLQPNQNEEDTAPEPLQEGIKDITSSELFGTEGIAQDARFGLSMKLDLSTLPERGPLYGVIALVNNYEVLDEIKTNDEIFRLYQGTKDYLTASTNGVTLGRVSQRNVDHVRFFKELLLDKFERPGVKHILSGFGPKPQIIHPISTENISHDGNWTTAINLNVHTFNEKIYAPLRNENNMESKILLIGGVFNRFHDLEALRIVAFDRGNSAEPSICDMLDLRKNGEKILKYGTYSAAKTEANASSVFDDIVVRTRVARSGFSYNCESTIKGSLKSGSDKSKSFSVPFHKGSGNIDNHQISYQPPSILILKAESTTSSDQQGPNNAIFIAEPESIMISDPWHHLTLIPLLNQPDPNIPKGP
jgi:hypothetical protein